MRMTGNVSERASYALSLIGKNQAVMLEQAPGDDAISMIQVLAEPWTQRGSLLASSHIAAAEQDRSRRFNFKTRKWEERWQDNPLRATERARSKEDRIYPATPKASVSLLPPHGRIKLQADCAFALLFPLDECDQKNEQYVFKRYFHDIAKEAG